MVLGSDHFHPWVDDASAAGFVWSWLGAVAARTERVQLGTAVTCPLFHYHPALVAQMAATADRLSGGRLMLGVGTGEAINERPLGWEFPGYTERQERMQEALEIIHRLFAGEKLSFSGELLHDRDGQAVLAAGRATAGADGGRRPQVGRVRRALRGRPDHQREGPGGHGGQGHRAVPAGGGRARRPPSSCWPPGGPCWPTAPARRGRRCPRCAGCAPRGGWRRPTPPNCGTGRTRWTGPRCSAATPPSPTRPG